MSTRIKRLNEDDWSQVEELLDLWFAAKLNRNDSLPFRSSSVSVELARFAASVYKRGAANIIDLDSQNSFAVKHVQFDVMPKAVEPVLYWDDFFDRELRVCSPSRCVVMIDEKLAQIHPKITRSCLSAGLTVITLKCSEDNKNLEQVRDVYRMISDHTDTAFIIGGGICCDVGAFVGSLLGLRLVLVPTTLLAVVDAGLGGKTGVNHPLAGKNQIGLFAHIDAIIPIQEFMVTLGKPLILDGLSEILKHAWLAGRFSDWSNSIEMLLQVDAPQAIMSPHVVNMVRENLMFKRTIVERDPFEKNLRIMLNLGHTLGHLLEAYNLSLKRKKSPDYIPMLSHGLSVCLGMWCLLDNRLLKSEPDGFRAILERVISSMNLDRTLFNLSSQADQAEWILSQDKKNNTNSSIRLVVPEYAALARLPVDSEVADFLAQATAQRSANNLLELLKKSGIVR